MWRSFKGETTRVFIIGLLVFLIAGPVGAPAFAQLFEEGLALYSGDPADQSGLKIGSWGSGKFEEDPRLTYSGSRSLKVSGRSLYDGVRIDFPEPRDITTYFDGTAGYLQVVAKFRVQAEESMYGGMGYSGAYDTTASTSKPVRRVRVAAALDGVWLEGQVPLSACRVGEDGWMHVSIPLSAMKSNKEIKEARLKRLVITGDGNEPFYIGAIRLMTDDNPIQVFRNDDQYVAARDDVMFRASCEPGAAAVKYSWDFDASDGIQEDSVGEVVYHPYRKSGDYTVTLTVSDLFGVKKAVSTTSKVTVYD